MHLKTIHLNVLCRLTPEKQQKLAQRLTDLVKKALLACEKTQASNADAVSFPAKINLDLGRCSLHELERVFVQRFCRAFLKQQILDQKIAEKNNVLDTKNTLKPLFEQLKRVLCLGVSLKRENLSQQDVIAGLTRLLSTNTYQQTCQTWLSWPPVQARLMRDFTCEQQTELAIVLDNTGASDLSAVYQHADPSARPDTEPDGVTPQAPDHAQKAPKYSSESAKDSAEQPLTPLSLQTTLHALIACLRQLEALQHGRLDEMQWLYLLKNTAARLAKNTQLPKALRARLHAFFAETFAAFSEKTTLEFLRTRLKRQINVQTQGHTVSKKDMHALYGACQARELQFWYEHPLLPARLAKRLWRMHDATDIEADRFYQDFVQKPDLDESTLLRAYAGEISILTQIQGVLATLPQHTPWLDVLKTQVARTEKSWPLARLKVAHCIDLIRLIRPLAKEKSNSYFPSERLCLSWLKQLYPEREYPLYTASFQTKQKIFAFFCEQHLKVQTLSAALLGSRVRTLDKTQFPDVFWELKQRPKQKQAILTRYLEHYKNLCAQTESALKKAFLLDSPTALKQILRDIEHLDPSTAKQWYQALKPDFEALPLIDVNQNALIDLEKTIRRDIQDLERTLKDSAWVTQDAGLVLLWPLLTRFFTQQGWWQDTHWQDQGQAQAFYFLKALLAPSDDADALELISAKLLTGYAPDAFIGEDSTLEAPCTQDFWQQLLHACPYLNKLGPEGTKQLFLQRQGTWKPCEFGYTLEVDTHVSDVVLNHLPWPLSFIKLLWQDAALRVHWPWLSVPIKHGVPHAGNTTRNPDAP